MLRLAKAQVYVLFKGRTFKVLCVISILLGLILIGGAKLASSEELIRSSLKGMSTEQQDEYIKTLKESADGSNSIISQGSGGGFRIKSKDIFNPTAKEVFYSSFGVGAMEIIMSVLIAAMVASEYSSGTIKNVLSYGKKREEYYIAKLLSCTVGFTIILGIIVSVSTIGSGIIFGWGEPFTINEALGILKVFLGAIVVGMGTTSVLMLAATLVKNNGSTIAIGIVGMSIIPLAITFLYGKFNWFDKIYEVTLAYNWELVTFVNASDGQILKAAVVGFIIAFIATVLGITALKKQDIK